MALTFDTINQTIGRTMQVRQDELASFTQSMNPESTTDLLRMQQMMQEWTMVTQLQSTMVKEIGDALKGIIQKSG
ncbi:EscF/YscF/HrpA family type III secretion system needle major subunit [Telmatospirillum sp. J64-1]|uniref:EscF/YscF/HrpA family type III secretion system needle major subunit n=1 Tax=Telmatospirillum sp. J64-1 TaxID=2502183 RepID=UPI00115C7DCA|nr:EscF/YscF/HrpA family type III secretion system needle major subunit [Telmatospirillum sp. J64-1]